MLHSESVLTVHVFQHLRIRKLMAPSHRSSSFKWSIAPAALVVVLALTGCQAEGAEGPTTEIGVAKSVSPGPAKSTPTPTSTVPEPTPASSARPAVNIPVPKKPARADKNTKVGLETFTKWWLELFSYGYLTNDWKKFWTVTDPGCKTLHQYY